MKRTKVKNLSKQERIRLERWSEWKVDCTFCGERKFSPCRNTKTGKRAKPHVNRIEAYMDYEEQEALKRKRKQKEEAECVLDWLDSL